MCQSQHVLRLMGYVGFEELEAILIQFSKKTPFNLIYLKMCLNRIPFTDAETPPDIRAGWGMTDDKLIMMTS